MPYYVRLRVNGDFACFTRPEIKTGRVSYDVMTPLAARGILKAVHWKPAILWKVKCIHVLKPIRFQTILRDQDGPKISAGKAHSPLKAGSLTGTIPYAGAGSQQCISTLLCDVDYVIEASLELTANAGIEDTVSKHVAMFSRRAMRGRCFHQPCLGMREFPAAFSLLSKGDDLPASALPLEQRNRDLGWMLHDIDFADGHTSRFIHAQLTDNVLDVERCLAKGLRFDNRSKTMTETYQQV